MKYIGIYLLLSIIATGLLSRGNLKAWFLKLTIVLLLPIIGWCLPVVWPKSWFKKDENDFAHYLAQQTEDIEFKKQQALSKIEKQHELNSISIEEALLVNDVSIRRKVLIDVLKEDAMQYIDVLKIAVINDDTETSHYAVTAVVEVKRKLTLLMQKLEVEYHQNQSNSEIVKAYAHIIQEYLQSGFLDTHSKEKYQVQYIVLMAQIIKNGDATAETFIEKFQMELAVQDLLAAEDTMQLFKQRYPKNEHAYISAMKLYYETHAIERLFMELQALKAAPITFSNETMNYVRYWSEVLERYERTIEN